MSTESKPHVLVVNDDPPIPEFLTVALAMAYAMPVRHSRLLKVPCLKR
ncbi:MAG TPA: hypothetical protein VLM91_16960 [Candidatus Methylomirabilis sp.]|nr:hypothetical protein [Candidatus Methylomirabilis sp.]